MEVCISFFSIMMLEVQQRVSSHISRKTKEQLMPPNEHHEMSGQIYWCTINYCNDNIPWDRMRALNNAAQYSILLQIEGPTYM